MNIFKDIMMNKSLFALIAVIAVCTSCAKEIQEVEAISSEQQTLMTKLVGGTQGAIIPGNLLVKMDEATAGELSAGNFAVFNEIAGVSVAPALPVQPKNMEVAKKYGLHQWYSISFDVQVKPETMAKKLAQMEQVKAIQYSRVLEPIFNGEALPFDLSVATKTADSVAPKDSSFNDPYLQHQWNLINNGGITADAVEGADVGVKDAWRLTGGDPSVVVAVFDCAVNNKHYDLADAVWINEKELNGTVKVDDDGNGFIDDIYGFNFVGCTSLNSNNVGNKLNDPDKSGLTGIEGKALDWWSGSGHGTHVAGIIGAINNNGIGVSSIAGGSGKGDGVRLMTCQIFQGDQAASDAQSAAAFIYAADNGACIAQCSYGTSTIITEDDTYINGGSDKSGTKINGSPLENAALQYFLDPANSNHKSLKGNMAIFAAGNHSNPYSSYPGALPYVISVTAFGIDHLPGGYTNYGPGCKIAAPGGEFTSVNDKARAILSTGVSNAAVTGIPGVTTPNGREDNQYVFMQGTSMACPHVSGVLALGISYAHKLNKEFSREELTSLLLTSVNDIDSFCSGLKTYQGQGISLDRYKGNMGTGAVDAWKFLMAIEGIPTRIVKAGETASIDLTEWLGSSANTLQYSVTVDEATRTSLGLTEDPVIRNGIMEIKCTNVGAGKITFSSSIGKDNEKENGIGEMAFSREVSIVSRSFAASNGGWF